VRDLLISRGRARILKKEIRAKRHKARHSLSVSSLPFAASKVLPRRFRHQGSARLAGARQPLVSERRPRGEERIRLGRWAAFGHSRDHRDVFANLCLIDPQSGGQRRAFARPTTFPAARRRVIRHVHVLCLMPTARDLARTLGQVAPPSSVEVARQRAASFRYPHSTCRAS